MTSKSFRATSGLDAAGEKVINVGKATRTTLSDGVNVDFFNEFNTVQQYSSTRGYASEMAVIFGRRLWYAKADIASPAGTFDESKWFATRNDPKWVYNNVTSTDGLSVDAGTYMLADGRFSELVYILPDVPIEGDIITIKDGGGLAGVNNMLVKSNTRQIRLRDIQSAQYRITHPYMTVAFIYNGNAWRVQEMRDNRDSQFINATGAGVFQLQAGMETFRNSGSGKITMQLPRYANDGDSVDTYDLDRMGSVNAATLQIHPNSGHTITYDSVTGATSVTSQRSGYGIFIFDAANSRWVIYDGDDRVRLRKISSDLAMLPNDYVFVTGVTGAPTQPNITLTLPTDVADGDRVYISLYMLMKGQNCTINVKGGTTDKIRTNKNMMQFPQRKDYPPDDWFSVTTLSFNADTDYLPYIEMSYMKPTKEWVIAQYRPLVERVDPTNRSRLGVIALAAQSEVNKNLEDNPDDQTAITPLTLATKTATETRRGIARIGTTAEVNQISTATYLDDVIVTPKKLNERTATETRRGLAEIATQAETNTGTDDITIVTPKKLDTRRSTETMAGISPLVVTGATTVEGTLRGDAGTNIYNFNENTRSVTAKSLNEKTSTEKSKGLVVLATDVEVITGAAAGSADMPIVVTPVQLHKKTATESRIGFTQTATQTQVNAGTDDFTYISPLKLNSRGATETLTGLISLATTAEVAAGTVTNKAVVPLKLKEFFNVAARTAVAAADGLTQSGTIWTTVNFGIRSATETQRGTLRVATQAETNTGTDDATIITPKKLQAKKATDTAEGIIRCATNAEAAAGTASNLAITPATMQFLNGTDPAWGGTTTRRGAVFITTKANTFIGDNTVGSTQAVDDYLEDFYAVSPRGLNFALQNFLPLNATAQNSLKLGNVVAASWMRRDAAQTVTGANTYSGVSTFTNVINVTSTGESKINTLRVNGSGITPLIIGTDGVDGANGIQFYAATGATKNNWTLTASGTGTTQANNEFGFVAGTAEAFVINALGDGRFNRDLNVTRNLSVTGTVNVGGVAGLSATATNVVVGNPSRGVILRTSGTNWNGVTLSNADGVTATMLNDRNFNTFVDSSYVKKSGDIMTGGLIISQTNTSLRFVTSNNRGYVQAGNVAGATDPTIQSLWLTGYNGVPLTELNINTAVANYENMKINGNVIYHAGRKPTPAEIGAVALTGSTVNDLTVVNSIKIGNVRITANPVTKTAEFTWEP